MLVNLKIKNIALISESSIDFKNGLNIITGETGAGKSLLIDSLNFVLGERADKTLIKHGEKFARVDAVFEIDIFDEKIKDFFDLIGIEPEDTVRITRQMNLEGKNECRVNGEQVTVNMLKKLTNLLVDIHGQHEHQSLLDGKNHLHLLDQFDKKGLKQNIEVLATYRDELRNINTQIAELGGLDEDREKNIEILNFNIEEIEKAQIKIEEEEELLLIRNRMRNSEKMFESFNYAYNQLNTQNIDSALKTIVNQLQNVEQFDEKLVQMKDSLDSVRYEFMDWQEEFLDYYQKLDYNEDELNKIEERLELLKDLKRKYGGSIESVLQYLEDAKNKKEMYEHSEEKLQECLHSKKEILNKIFAICQELTQIRKDIAKVVEQAIIIELKDLGMYNANFVVQFYNDYTLDTIEKHVSSYGADKLEFLFSANLGEPVRPLSKIISGGEMSRFMLAIKCVLNTEEYMKTLIFDEIDSGIGGKTGGKVGQKLYNLSKCNQIICITHLSSIACYADHHMQIEKSTDEGHTYTNLKILKDDLITLELMRMNGVENGSTYGKLHAEEMIKEATQFKSSVIAK